MHVKDASPAKSAVRKPHFPVFLAPNAEKDAAKGELCH
jgi:hypothetical protein